MRLDLLTVALFTTLWAGGCAPTGPGETGGGDVEPDGFSDKEDGVCECSDDGEGLVDEAALLLGVNRGVGLASEFEPEVVPVSESYRSKFVELRPLAAGYFMKLADAAKDATGRRIQVGSGYRSFCTQCGLFQHYANQHGEEEANTFSAHAGHSEHQLGTTTDIFNDRSQFQGGPYDIPGTATADPSMYQWLDEHGWEYGYMNSYPPNDDDNGDRFQSRTFFVTRYIPEPWHWRFVGKRAAEVHRRLHLATGIRYSTHEFIDLLDALDARSEVGKVDEDAEREQLLDELAVIMAELDYMRADLEVPHPDDQVALERALADSSLQCMSGTLGRPVGHGECVQVNRADCGLSSCAWFRCDAGQWQCVELDVCTAEAFAHASCPAP